jgi:ATP-dependent protease HslVU (ClpYQ) peptidase subunit
MTTLVAIQGDGWTVLGCDSRLSDEDGRYSIAREQKIVDNNGILIAGSGSTRAINILHYGYPQPKPTAAEDLNKFMTRKFIPEMRKHFIEAGIDTKKDEGVAENEGGFLISVKAEIFAVQSDYSWDTDVLGVYVMGSGGDVAQGALAALGVEEVTTHEEAEKIIRKAIEIAIAYDMHSFGPIHIFKQFK